MFYISFCTRGGECRRGGSRLGADRDERDARWRISNHLHTSSYHNLSLDDAEEESRTAELVEEEAEEEASLRDHAEGDGAASSWRHGPYDKGKGKSKGWNKGDKGGKGGKADMTEVIRATVHEMLAAPPPSAPHSVMMLSSPPAMTLIDRLVQHVSRAEAAARSSARLARSAAQAFEEEAGHFRDVLEELSQSRV